jgi:hypothetical protein
MKKFYVLILLVICIGQNQVTAQNITNADFETWVTIPNTFGGQDPTGWKSTNAATAGANIKGITRSTDKYSGQYALSIQPLITMDANDTLTSSIVLGVAPLSFSSYYLDYAKGGEPSPYSHVLSVNGYYKFTAGFQTFDSVYAVVLCKDANTSSLSAKGHFVFEPSQTYTPFSVPVNLVNSNPSDSLVVAFFYKSNSATPFSNARLLVDSLFCKERSFTGMVTPTMLQSHVQANENRLSVMVNRAGFYKLSVHDIDGKQLYYHTGYIFDRHEAEFPGNERAIIVVKLENEQGDVSVKKYILE